MTDAQLKQLKDDLWHSADMLRASAHLAANKYGQPILGLIRAGILQRVSARVNRLTIRDFPLLLWRVGLAACSCIF